MKTRTGRLVLPTLLLLLSLSGSASAQGDKQAVYGILIDNTGSMRSQFGQVVLLSKEIVKRIYQQGSVSLFNFRTTGDKKNQIAVVYSGVQKSQDWTLLSNSIDHLFIVPGQTALLDAINAMAESLNSQVAGEKDLEGKVIFVLSDGEDRVSKVKEKELIKNLKDTGVKVYAVGLVQELETAGGIIIKNPKDKAMDFLRKITKETGGRVVFPKSRQQDLTSVLNELFAH